MFPPRIHLGVQLEAAQAPKVDLEKLMVYTGEAEHRPSEWYV